MIQILPQNIECIGLKKHIGLHKDDDIQQVITVCNVHDDGSIEVEIEVEYYECDDIDLEDKQYLNFSLDVSDFKVINEADVLGEPAKRIKINFDTKIIKIK